MTTPALAHHHLPEYDGERDNWRAYVIKAEAYFEATGVTDTARKRALLVAALNTKTVQILAGRVAPKKPNSLTYEEVVATLNEYFDPKRHEITESFRFFNRCQHEGEPLQHFLVDIRRIADNCNFGSMLERMLRDRIVCGVRSKALQKQLLAKANLTLEEAEAIALSAETADDDANKISGDTTTVLKVDAQRVLTNEPTLKCGRCGSKKHNSHACRWAKSRCYHCGRPGHLAKMCSSDAPRKRETASTQGMRGRALAMAEDCAEGNVDEAMHLWTLTSSRKWQLEPPIHRTFTWCGVDMPMLIDTGSPVCVVPREIYEKNWERWPPLQPSGVKLSCYLGKLPVLGQLDMKVAYKGAVVECPLIVLNCPGPSLCGRDLLFQLSNAGSPILHTTAEAGSPTSLPAADDIANEFQDVFSAELGCISGPPVHLQLKEGATPKFWSTQETEEWTPPPDTAVYARNYGQGEKWTPGKVQSTTGSRMVTIQTPTGVVRRHIDQVRSRPSPASARSGVRDQDEGSPSAAAAPAPTDNEGDLNEQPTDQVAPAQASPPIQKAQEPPQALRRSTRERKPVQRLQY
ncbi:uncharacterized protein ISCGN_006535 [Ixodes scapularis]